MKGASTMVALADGTEVLAASDAWRMECLVRHLHVQSLLRMRGVHLRHQRQQYLANVAAAEGAESAGRLQAALHLAWGCPAPGVPADDEGTAT